MHFEWKATTKFHMFIEHCSIYCLMCFNYCFIRSFKRFIHFQFIANYIVICFRINLIYVISIFLFAFLMLLITKCSLFSFVNCTYFIVFSLKLKIKWYFNLDLLVLDMVNFFKVLKSQLLQLPNQLIVWNSTLNTFH